VKLENVRQWREARGYTQRRLAKEAGLSTITLPRIERGEQTTPTTARKIADALGVDIMDLMSDPPVPAGKGEARGGGQAEPGNATDNTVVFGRPYTKDNHVEVLKKAARYAQLLRSYYGKDTAFALTDDGTSIELRVTDTSTVSTEEAERFLIRQGV
jgi:transcriptional regulator with XRE-family HTH domain